MIKLRIDLEFGDAIVLKDDAEQTVYRLIGIVIMPGNQVKLLLSFLGEPIEVWDFEVIKLNPEAVES